jgi:hypothetical protein
MRPEVKELEDSMPGADGLNVATSTVDEDADVRSEIPVLPKASARLERLRRWESQRYRVERMIKSNLDERAAVEGDDVRAQPRKRAIESIDEEVVSLGEPPKKMARIESDRSTPDTL